MCYSAELNDKISSQRSSETGLILAWQDRLDT